MKKSDLEKIVGEDIGYWEIMTIDYEFQSKKLDLLLQEFEWKGAMFGRDYKLYLGNLKRIIIFDEFAFEYCEDKQKINSIEQYIQSNKGIDFNNLRNIFNDPSMIITTSLQFDWITILQRLNIFNKEEYNKIFTEELKKHLINYCTAHPERTDLLEFIGFFEEISNNLK